MNRYHLFLSIAAAAIALANPASAASLSYTIFVEGAVTGSLNGVAFTATSFSLSATGDSSTIQSWGDTQLNPITAPVVQINTSSGDPLTTTLLPSASPDVRWNALVADTGTLYGFILSQNDQLLESMILLTMPTAPRDLSTPATHSGSFREATNPLASTGGTLALLADEGVPASFTVAAVPEPATATSSLLLSLAGLSLISRRNRKA